VLVAVRAQRVEADGETLEPCPEQRLGVLLQQHTVGRQREVRDVGERREARDEALEVAAQERLTARQAHLRDSEVLCGAHDPLELLERQEFALREPGVLLLGHAVPTPQVAAVRDREPQAAERAPVQIVGGGGGGHRGRRS
jgi:hypothetical protein